MARRRSDRIYGASGHPMLEALPLMLAFLVGTIGGIALKLGGAHPLVSAGFAAAVLFAYAIITWIATPLRMDSETIGDNAYYLGFLFTLTSLAVTLYFVIEAGSETARLIPEIISGFGVALSSTIVGVFLRVLMLQLKVDVEARERRVRLELDESARRFRTELGISLDKVKSFSTESLQQASEREARMRTASEAMMVEMQAELLKSAAEFGPALRESIQAQAEAAFSEITKAVAEVSAKAAEEIRSVMREMSGITGEIAKAGRNTAADVTDGLERLKFASETLAESSELTVTRLMAAERKARELSEALAGQLMGGSDGLATAISDARKMVEVSAVTFGEAAGGAGAAMQDAARRFEEGLTDSTAILKVASEKVGAGIEEACARLERAVANSAAAAEDVAIGTPAAG
ncbi:hypothetical protein [Paracoccus litorisediminis]|uniref:Uncharacterized protein n=1 Tax=Paracoccus litorisediminis TaxID=2006130 RepID=A0A844HKW6_9RHOB|nr:hypothetical protein [Paracoccus litorisediminis]MTH60883.1 hypothetical protein [Paracoccus litorisediminis]